VAEIGALIDAEVAEWDALLARLQDAVESDLTRRAAGSGGSDVAPPARLADLRRTGQTAFDGVAASSPRVLGAGFIARPESFPDAPGLVWVTRSATGGRVERLVVDAEFYGYTSAPWWLNTIDDDAVHTTGPYVDASGTTEYIATHGRRLTADGELIGVVAVDVLVSQLQRHLQTAICRLPRGSCVTDTDGAVIVTNSGRLLGANLSEGVRPASVHPVASTGWTVVVGAGE
jgi:hypothetical protein